MKKFIIAIATMFIMMSHNFCAHASVVEVSDAIKNKWGFSQNETFATYNDYDVQKNKTDQWNFQYVNISAATKIYEHGAEFCRIQLQHTYGNWKIFVDPNSCKTICKDGYYGNNCSSPSTNNSDVCESDKLNQHFINTTPTFNNLTSDIYGFDADEEKASLLVIRDATEKSITVVPIEFSGQNNDKTNIAKISAKGESTTMCAQGYKKDEDNICVVTTRCKTGDSTQCENGQGLDEYNKCVTCGNDIHSGIKPDGKCEKCGQDKMFDKTTERCESFKQIPNHDMRSGPNGNQDCWKITNIDEYKNCVLPD